jgi:hypothetical protein
MGVLSLSHVGGYDPLVIPHAGARFSWALSGVGSFSCVLPATLARRFDFEGAEQTGTRWIRYEQAYLPDWGGVLTMPGWSDGEFEIGGESFEVLLRKRRVPRNYGQQSATPGALAQRAFTDVQADDPTGIVSFEADEWGAPVSWEWRGGDLHDDVFRQLASASGQEYRVDADRNLEWRVRLGEDKSGSVLLAAGHQIVSYRYDADLWTIENDIEGVATDERYERSVNAIRDHTDSIRTFGRRYQASRRYERVVKGGTLVRQVWTDLKRSAWPAETMEVTTINVGGSWETYHVGDSIVVWVPDADVVKQCRIVARAIDIDAQTESLALEVEREADGW